MLGRGSAVLIGGLLVALPATAGATWSVVGVDADTGEAGVAVASCVEAPFGTNLLPQVAGVVPGIGALAAQALLSQYWRDQAVMLLAAGNSPQDVIDMVVAADGGSASRQYGVVTLDGQTATFTGAATMDWAGDVQGTAVTAQGNILYGPEVVDDALAAYQADAPDCPFTLADRLMAGLEAGSAQGGDTRCSEEQSALAAVLIVARSDDDIDAPYIDLRIPSQRQGGENPVDLLRAEYDAWRAKNPPDDSGCGGGTSSTGTGPPPASTGDGGASTSTTSGSAPPASTAGDDAATTGPAADTTGGTPPATDTDTEAAAAGDASGCGCTTGGGAGGLVLLVVAGARRRRGRHGNRPSSM